MMDIRDDKPINIAFLNPAMPENQEWALRFIREILTKYRFDAYALDYCRYPGATADFSEFSHRDFEKFLGHAVERFPEDIFTYDKDGNRVPGKYYKQWWEYRAKVIRNFIARVRSEIDSLQPGVELEYWAASWLHAIHANGQNWASPRSDFSREYLDSWATPGYKEAGFADLLDVFITGTYLERVWGADDPESIEFGLNRSLRDVQGDCTVYGSLYAKNHLDQFDDAVYLCLQKTKGVMVFDIIQVIDNNLWDAIRRVSTAPKPKPKPKPKPHPGTNKKPTNDMILTIKRLFPVLCALLLIGAGACSEATRPRRRSTAGKRRAGESPSNRTTSR